MVVVFLLVVVVRVGRCRYDDWRFVVTVLVFVISYVSTPTAYIATRLTVTCTMTRQRALLHHDCSLRGGMYLCTQTRPDLEQLRLETPSPSFVAAKNEDEHVQRLSYYGARVTTLKGHDSSVTSLCTLHDGRLASASDDATIKIWDASKGTLIKTLDNRMAPIYCLSTLPDPNLIAGGSDTDITIWDTRSAKAVKVLRGHASYVWCMAMVKMKTGDDVLASVSADKSLRLWCVDAKSHQYGECLSQAQEHRDSIYSLAVFPQQTCFATGSADTTVIIWRPSGRSRHYTHSTVLRGHTKLVYSLVAVSDTYLASASDDCTIRIWHTVNGQCLHKLDAHQGAVTCLSAFLGHDGLQYAPVLFSGSRDCEAKIWNLQDMVLERTLSGHKDEVLCLSVLLSTSECGVLATGCEDGTIHIWGVLQTT
eukprot:m.162185 g.162185  ORF g.162185 m.162185 type:complete len:422 (+) comp31266_c1_seq2:581-1846(+)